MSPTAIRFKLLLKLRRLRTSPTRAGKEHRRDMACDIRILPLPSRQSRLRTEAVMAKNIVICCDGAGNQVESNQSNVLKLFRILHKNDGQRVYYNPGMGTIDTNDPWTRLTQNTKGVFELATGYGLDDEILGAYRFVVENYQKDD